MNWPWWGYALMALATGLSGVDHLIRWRASGEVYEMIVGAVLIACVGVFITAFFRDKKR